MPNLTTDQEWIDSFLQNQLTSEEKVSFSQRLKEEGFAKQFEEQKLIAEGIRLYLLRQKVDHFQKISKEETAGEKDMIGQAFRHQRNLEVLERLKRKEEEIEESISKPAPKIKQWMGIAAGFLLPLGIALWLFAHLSGNQLPQDYFSAYPISGTKGNGNTIEGQLLYKEGKYDQALQALKIIDEKDAYYPEAQLLIGELLFKHKKDYKGAYKQFGNLLSQDKLTGQLGKDVKERVEWNSIVSGSAYGEESTLLTYSILANPSHTFHNNLIQLLKDKKKVQYSKWGAIFLGLIGLILLGLYKRQKNK